MTNSNFLLNYIHRHLQMGNDPERLDYAEKHIRHAKTFFPWPGVTFVLDLRTGQYLHLGQNFPGAAKHHYQPLKEGGYQYLTEILRTADLRIIDQILPKVFTFIADKPAADICNYWFTANFKINIERNEGFQFLQYFIVSEVDKQGLPLLITGICMDIDSFKTNNSIHFSISEYNAEEGLIRLSNEIFYPQPVQELTKREVEITRLLCEGKNNEYISQKLYISYHTAKTHRKNIYEKTNSKNVAELYNFYRNSL